VTERKTIKTVTSRWRRREHKLYIEEGMSDMVGCKIEQAETPEYLKSPYTKEDFEQDSRAVCVAGDDPSAGIVLWWEGAWLDREINEVGQGLSLENLQLHEAPAGVSIWTGRYVYETFETECGTEHDYEAVGDFRDLTPAEWLAPMRGEHPLDVEVDDVLFDVTVVSHRKLQKLNIKICDEPRVET